MSFRPRAMGVSQASRLVMVFGLLLTSLNLTFFAPLSAQAAPVTAVSSALVAQTSIKHQGSLVGSTSGSKILHLTVSLKESNPAAETAFIKDLYDPHSASYHQFLTPAQYAAQFGPSQTARSQVTAYLQSKGFNVTHNDANGSIISFEGTVSNLESAFGVKFSDYKTSNGRVFYGTDKTFAYPQALASYINGFVGLTNELQAHSNVKLRNPKQKPSLAPYNTGYSPSELRNAYNATSLITAGYDGSGQGVALVEFNGYNPQDVQVYDDTFGLGSPTAINVSIDGAAVVSTDGNAEIEDMLDIETVNALAPKAQVYMYVANNDLGFGSGLDLYQQIATDDKAAQISSSWGYGGDGVINASEPAFIPANEQILRQFAVQGQSFFDAAGDADTYYADGNVNYNPYDTADYPGSSPYTTAVGGTSLYITGTDTTAAYVGETTWNDGFTANFGQSPIGAEGTGGGLSDVFLKSQTPWQTGPGTDVGSTLNPEGYRQMPDVAADADPATGIGIYSDADLGFSIYGVEQYYNGWLGVGGTSFATPEWASFAAIANQYAAKNGGSKIGFANPTLYSIFNNSTKYATDFHDITVGGNDPYCPNVYGGGPTPASCSLPTSNSYYSSTVGYDLATGIGTPNVAALVPDLAGLNHTTQLLASPGIVNLGVNNSYYPSSKTITLDALNGAVNYTTTVAYGSGSGWLTISAPSGSVSANGTVSVTLGVNSASLTTGYYTAVLTVTDTANANNYAVVQVNLDVNPQLSVATNNVSLTIHTTSPVSYVLKNITVTTSSATPITYSTEVEEEDPYGAIGAAPTYPSQVGVVSSGSPGAVKIIGGYVGLGVFTGTVYIFDVNDPLDRVAVNVTVIVIPDILPSATGLNFYAQEGGPNPAPQTLAATFVTSTNTSTVVTLTTQTVIFDGGNWLNFSPLTATITLGQTVTGTATVTINPPGFEPLKAGVYHGAIEIFQNNGYGAEIPVTLTVTGPAYTYGLPFVANNYNGFTDFLSMQNANPMTATVAVQYYDNTGKAVSADNKTIPPFGSASFQPNVVSGTAVTGIISSTEPLNVVVPEATPAGGSAYAIGNTASDTLYDPIAQNNGTFQTQLTVQNVASTPTTVTVTFYKDADGSQVAGATQTFALAPYTSKTLDQAASSSGLTNFSGWALITGTTGSQLSAQVLEQNPGARFVAILSASATPSTTIYAPAVFSSYLGSFNTGMNIVNTGSVPATITVSYYSVTGTLATTQTFANVPAHAIEGIYQPFVNGLGSTFNGSAVITSTQPVVVGVNENGGKTAAGNSESGTYTGLTTGGTSVGVPVQAFGAFGGYVTGATVQNLTSQTITVTYQYLDVNGYDEGSPQVLTIAPHASGQLFQGAADQSLPNGYFGTALVTSNVPNSIAIVTNAVNSAFFYTFTSPASS